MITSDYDKFAGDRPSEKSSTPTSNRWPELSFLCGYFTPIGVGLIGGGHTLGIIQIFRS